MTHFKPIVNMLNQAGKNLKHPKIRLKLEDETNFHLALAGSQSRYPGHVHMTDGGGFGNNFYYGRIDNHGNINWAKTVGKKEKDMVVKLLVDFQENPAQAAKVYGKLTSSCCFCGLGLTDERSVTAGYGPICAENYMLPWGDIDETVCNVMEEFTMAQENKQLTDDELRDKLFEPLTLEDAFKQIAELREMVWKLQKSIDHLYHRNH